MPRDVEAFSDVTPGTAVTALPLAGFSVDTAGLQSGNTMSLTYTDNAAVQHKVTIVRVDDPTVLPLPQTTTPDPNDQVVGVDFSAGMASVVSQLNLALGGAGLNFSNPAGTTLQVLNTLAATARPIRSRPLRHDVAHPATSAAPVFVDTSDCPTPGRSPRRAEQLGLRRITSIRPC
jgi:flagellar hook-associated protein 1 FlgK